MSAEPVASTTRLTAEARRSAADCTSEAVEQALRDGLTGYGDPEFSLFLRKRSSRRRVTTMTRCPANRRHRDTVQRFQSLSRERPGLIAAVRRGVLHAGGLPMEFPTISVHESFAHPTSMFLRNLMSSTPRRWCARSRWTRWC